MLRDGIKHPWVEAVINQPEFSKPDPIDPRLTLAWRRIPELGGRFVRVVYYSIAPDVVVVTTFPDRGASRRWRP
jgi:hypothetical protein